MNGSLKVDYSQLSTLSTNVIAKGDDFETLLGQINTINTELESYWKGTDASKYTTAVKTQAQTMQELATTINEIGTFLKKVGDAYQAAVDANASAIN